VLDGSEACDNGAANSDVTPDACREDCTLPRCGDGVVDGTESCEPGVGDPQGCSPLCQRNTCGDGQLDAGEECDDGADNSDAVADACRATCRAPTCGDGVIDSGEECERNDPSATALPCTATCTVSRCPDGTINVNGYCGDGPARATDVELGSSGWVAGGCSAASGSSLAAWAAALLAGCLPRRARRSARRGGG